MSQSQPNPREVADVMWAEDRASQSHGFELVDVTTNSCVLSVVVRDDMVNGLGVCHGGIVFMFADSAMAFATNAANHVALAVAASIDFVAPAYLGDTLTATAQHRWSGGRTTISDVAVTALSSGQDTPRIIALFHGRTSRTGGQIIESTPPALDAKS
jgi:phenylacetic acid degradation protein PaaD